MAEKPEKIEAIMSDRGVTALEAGRIYTLGALKAAKRRGTARNYREAVEALEAEQLGYRGDPLTRTVNADATASNIASCNRGIAPGYYSHKRVYRETGRYTKHGKPVYRYAGTVSEYVRGGVDNTAPMRVNTVDVIRMAWARMDNQPYTAYAQPYNWHTVDTPVQPVKRIHTRNMSKILGSMYTDIEYRQVEADPAHRYDRTPEILEANMTRYFAEYVSRLSRTGQMRLANLMAYIRRESNGLPLQAERVIKSLLFNKGKAAPETPKLAKFIDNLHQSFRHKDAVTCQEFVNLLYRYGGGDPA
jgi:hypothetical protein